MCHAPLAVATLAVSLLIGTASLADDAAVEPSQTLWERPELLRLEGGPRDWLESHGVDVELSLTQFYQGEVRGDGDHRWEYAGRGDLLVTADLAQLGLWNDLFLTVHGEGMYGDAVNFAGDGSVLPINTAMAFPRLVGGDSDLSSVHFTQKFPRGVALMLGKIDMLDVAARTPLQGGGGLSGFQNLAFAAPPSGLVPPSVLGGLLSVPLEPAKLTLGLYDPVNAMGSTGLEDPFAEGVTGLVSLTVPFEIRGRPGYHSLSAKANSKVGVDIDDLGGIFLPQETESALGEKRGPGT